MAYGETLSYTIKMKNPEFEFIDRLDRPDRLEVTVIKSLLESIRLALSSQLGEVSIDSLLEIDEDGGGDWTKLILCGATFFPGRNGVSFSFPDTNNQRQGYENQSVGFAIPTNQIAHIRIRSGETEKDRIWFPNR